jgi:hypothetical protein
MSIIRGTERRRESMLVLVCAMVISSCGDDGAQSTDSAVVASIQSTTSASGATLPLASSAPSASSAVSTSADAPLPATAATGGVDGPVVYAAAPNEPGSEAALGTGTVELVGQCLLLGGADAGDTRRPVIVWQFGTSWSADESEVILPDGRAVPIGSMISAGGGSHGADRLDDEQWLSDSQALERISDCVEYESTDNVFVIQDLVEVVS